MTPIWRLLRTHCVGDALTLGSHAYRPGKISGRRIAGLFVLMAALVSGPALAQSANQVQTGSEPPREVVVELNKLEQNEAACRAYLLLRNRTEREFTVFNLDLVLLGRDGVIRERLAVDVGPLLAGKTSVMLFDIAAVQCGDIGRMLISSVLECVDQSGSHADCVREVTARSKSKVDLFK